MANSIKGTSRSPNLPSTTDVLLVCKMELESGAERTIDVDYCWFKYDITRP